MSHNKRRSNPRSTSCWAWTLSCLTVAGICVIAISLLILMLMTANGHKNLLTLGVQLGVQHKAPPPPPLSSPPSPLPAPLTGSRPPAQGEVKDGSTQVKNRFGLPVQAQAAAQAVLQRSREGTQQTLPETAASPLHAEPQPAVVLTKPSSPVAAAAGPSATSGKHIPYT